MAAAGKCIILSAPSGAGKTSIVHYLLEQKDLRLEFSVSATNRQRRAHEVDGQDYHFLSTDDFLARADKGEFVEWEEVYPDQFYGTLRSEIERIWQAGHHAIFDVDVIGGLDLKEVFDKRALAIFVRPPSLGILEQRLRARATEKEEKIKERLTKAAHEIRYADRFDVILENEDLDTACAKARELVRTFIAT